MTARRETALALAVLCAVACALYLPFLSNPPVFDDGVLYSGYRFSEFASAPLGLGLRVPPFFTFAFAEIMWESLEVHRAMTLVLHAACALALFVLARDLAAPGWLALAAAAWFVAHPVAVYGAGYLVQRSVVMATLFSLLSVILFLRGLREQRMAGAVAAALAYSLAVLSKEHAAMVAAAAVAAVPLARAGWRHALRYSALYLALCAPAAVLVLLLSQGIVGTPYETQFESVRAEAARTQEAAEPTLSPWAGSALAQAAMFFRYGALWLWPSTSRMSIDLRVDFAEVWAPAVAVPAVLGFLAWGACGAWLLFRGGRARALGWGLLFAWLCFLVEFSVIRYQEPFVLYRSYLWAPGLAVALASALALLPRGAVLTAIGAAAVVLPLQAHDRLQSFSSGRAVWQDAADKLPAHAVPGGARTLYMLGREHLIAEQPGEALKVVERCRALYPETADCHFARGAIHMVAEEFEEAIPYIVRAIELRPGEGGQRHHLGWALENLGCIAQARRQYEISRDLGYVGGAWRLMALDDPGKGLIAPKKRRPPECPARLKDAAFPPRQG